MVPMDQPKVALDMITRFIGKVSLSAGLSKIEVNAADPRDCSGRRSLQGEGGVSTVDAFSVDGRNNLYIMCLGFMGVLVGLSWCRPKRGRYM